jgi:hypothetical protein
MAKFTKTETGTEVVYTPIQGEALGTYTVKKDSVDLDVHFVVKSSLVNKTWQQFAAELDLLT